MPVERSLRGELGPHVRDHHSDVHEWPCAQCSHRFPTHRGLRHHLWYYHLEGLFACPTAGCPYTAHLPIAIKQHRYRLHSPTYTCEHCRKQFKQRSNLIKDEDHEEVEEAGAAENDFGECSYSSEVRSHVHRHIRTRHLKALEQQQKVNKERGAGAAFTALAAIVALINEDLEKFVIEVEDKC
ncbi:hypothetical protein TYRP_017371 [Tyrophagus putrescentiae]|nr:hypothetical protein TYRP_017371 [Tyrophagus putrescentiae]